MKRSFRQSRGGEGFSRQRRDAESRESGSKYERVEVKNYGL